MGEAARRRKQMRQRLLGKYPWCVFCGGTTEATTVEHMPPITVFDGRQRPKGLEFAACEACNHGSRDLDQIVGFVSRFYPDASTDVQRHDIERVIQAMVNNFPELCREVHPGPKQSAAYAENYHRLPADSDVVNASGPMLNQAMRLFGAKCGLALHWEATGKIIPSVGAVGVRWYTNYQAVVGDFPFHILDRFGTAKSLHQGRKRVGDQFEYASVATDDGTLRSHTHKQDSLWHCHVIHCLAWAGGRHGAV